MTSVERWLAYFSNKLDPKEMEELAMNEAAIQTALDSTTIFMQDKKERLNYLNREMAIFDYESDKDAWISEGRAEGADLNSVELIKNLMSTSNLSIDEAMTALKIPEEKQAKYRAMVTDK